MAEHTYYLEPIENSENKFKAVNISHFFFNDKVMNEYMDLITERLPDKVYAFNTFFYTALSDKGYSHVCRWTKKIDVFRKQKLFIPIYIENHWGLVYVCFPQKFIKYYDSMGGSNKTCLRLIKEYLRLEHIDKKGEDFDSNGWLLANVNNCPQQSNIWDCGVFICIIAEYLSRDAPLDFSEQHIEQFREQIALEIKEKKLKTPVPSLLFGNDEVINEYMDLITQSSPETVYAFNTFFYRGLCVNGYSDAGRWTKIVDIFAKQKLFIPIHIGDHWCVAYVCFPQKYIKYCDCIIGRHLNCLQLILTFLNLEHRRKKKEDFNTDGWSMNAINCPQQLNTRDCLIFVCMNADHFLRGTPLDFSKKNKDKYWRQIALEIEKNKQKKSDPRHLFYNDEVIDNYLDLITERSPDTVYAFTTCFYQALSDQGYSNVRRWTKNIDIFSKQKLFIPIHIKNHWCLVYVCFPKKSIEYYDSLGGSNHKCLLLIIKYLVWEHIDKKGEEFNPNKWSLGNMKNCPRQLNTWDCGVFVCMFAEYLSRDAGLNFSQQDMGQFRRQIASEIKKKKLYNSVPETAET